MKQHIRINEKYSDLTAFIEALPSRFSEEGNTIYDARNRVKIFHPTPDGAPIVVKSYRIPRLFQRVVYTFFRKSKALRAYEYASRLISSGIRTPEGIACIELYRGGLLAESYFISAFTPLESLHDKMDGKTRIDLPLVKSTAAFIATLHDRGILHGDPNLTNLLVDTSVNPPVFELIDTNRSKFKKHLSHSEIITNLVRLTHIRPLSEALTREYALLTGRNPESTIREVQKGLEHFERSRRIRHRIKDIFK